MVDFKTYKFRCSSLPVLMTNGRSKAEILSETAKTALREIWIEAVYGREKLDVGNKYTEKGLMCESDAMELVQRVRGEVYFKNKKTFENEFIKGTPDIVIECEPKMVSACKIKDIKNSFDIWTFNNVDEDYALKTYSYQMFGYMWLTSAHEAELLFTLVNVPEEIISDEIYRNSFKHPEIQESDEATNKFRKNYIFDDIPEKDRVKSFVIPFNDFDVELVKMKLTAAREYLKTLSL